MSEELKSNPVQQFNLGRFSGFFSKPLEERRRLLNPGATEGQRVAATAALDSGGLVHAVGDKMIENYVGILGMPVSYS